MICISFDFSCDMYFVNKMINFLKEKENPENTLFMQVDWLIVMHVSIVLF